ncbi:MAG: HAD hydrolase-like protein, partial [Oscillospiraceae bacterium]
MQIINSPKIKYFFFDLDGTIFNSIEDIADCCNMALEKFRLPTHGTSKYLDFIGNGERLLIERAIGESRLDNEIFALVRNEYDRLYHENYRRKSRPFDGVCEMLGKI